jgi:GTP cyclohydrolase II
MIHTPELGNTLYTRPSELKKLVTPETLRIPGNFYMSDALNFLEEWGVFNGVQLSDNGEYSLEGAKVHPFRNVLPDVYEERPVSLHAVQGDPETEGAAFAAIVGDIEDGMLVRLHSECAYSEMGRALTNKLYSVDLGGINSPEAPPDPDWFYNNIEKLMSSFIKYGDGIVASYPTCDNLEKSVDCDCCLQRKLAQFAVAVNKGIEVSLSGWPQEGRGLGPTIKEKIYRLQAQGMSSAAACHALGLPVDVREYGHVVRFIKGLGLKCISLMTNNPRKIWPFVKAGIEVIRVPLISAYLSHEARKYVVKKGEELGHEVEEKSDFILHNGRLRMETHPSLIGLPKYVSSSDIVVLREAGDAHISAGQAEVFGREVIGEYNALYL